ncbi:hypothetical protein ACHAXR_002106, partial [Thalassiosira sp. AJA248-18]
MPFKLQITNPTTATALLSIIIIIIGHHASAAQPLCQPIYTPNNPSYTTNTVISATSTTETTTYKPCTIGEVGCEANGFETIITTTTKTNNYQCTNSDWCSMELYEPTGLFGGGAWTMEVEECVGTAPAIIPSEPTTSPTPDAWSGIGCPAPFSSGTDYESGDSVSVNIGAYKMVYTCVNGANSAFCGMPGYEPGGTSNTNWETAWIAQGSCTGSIAPTKSPSFVTLANVGGCPGEYVAGTEYDENDKISKDGYVYQCKVSPTNLFCGLTGYEPQIGPSWNDAWDLIGYCNGTITPTTSPIFVNMMDAGGCPSEYSSNEEYQEGDKVSHNKFVYECKKAPLSEHCSQNGYAPGVLGTSWLEAWTVVGYCDGTIAPTTSPIFVTLVDVGGCHVEFLVGEDYEEGDKVSKGNLVYECKEGDVGKHCSQAGYE